jgi:hypothetical protein
MWNPVKSIHKAVKKVGGGATRAIKKVGGGAVGGVKTVAGQIHGGVKKTGSSLSRGKFPGLSGSKSPSSSGFPKKEPIASIRKPGAEAAVSAPVNRPSVMNRIGGSLKTAAGNVKDNMAKAGMMGAARGAQSGSSSSTPARSGFAGMRDRMKSRRQMMD